MELTPTIFVGLGRLPAAALVRFKQESVWRPAAVRAMARVLFPVASEPGVEPGAAPGPVPAGILAGVIHGWTAPDCAWPAPGDLRSALRTAQADTLSAANLEAVRALPGYTVRVREYQESFAPELCLLADATEPAGLAEVLAAAADTYGRPVTLVLTLPAPFEETWAGARDLVRRLAGGPEAAMLERIWLVSREQETGEVLARADLIDALAQFCHLFAYSGWYAEPDLRRFFLREEAEGLLATFGLRAARFSAPAALRGRLLEEGYAALDGLLDQGAPADVAGALDGALARGREQARRRVPEVPFPLPGEEHPGQWRARAKLRWAPEAQRQVHGAIAEALAPLHDQIRLPLLAPARQQAELTALVAAIRRQQAAATRPPGAPDATPAFARLADLRRSDRWWPLLVKAVISTIGSGALAWTYFPPGATTAGAVLMATAWFVVLAVLFGLNLRDRRRALAELQEAVRAWAAGWTEELIHGETIQQLQGLASAALAAEADAALAVERLREARALLDAEAAVNQLPPVTTALCASVPGRWPVELSAVEPGRLVAADPAETARLLLERSWQGYPVGEDELAPHDSFVDASPVHVLLPVRAIQPSDGEPLRAGSIMLTSGSPFLRARFVLTRPFALPGSARFDPIPERRVSV